ncbi:hypothetical protein ACN28E_40985 [Archangium lansingense]|uniref:hypothetical protein n=1 Tax=Archangium lansingense TaxID=2995310 RepID=UPI003B7CD368
MTSYSVPSSIDNPLAGFSINYTLTGEQRGSIGAGIATIEFYLSDTPSGSNQVYLLATKYVLLSGSGQFGPFYPPSGTLTATLSQADMEPAAVALLENIVTGCQPQSWYILAYVVKTGSLTSASSTLGGWRQPDHFFTAGALSPSAIQPGGTTNLSFTLYRNCPGYYPSSVGVYLADANFQLLSYIGGVSTPGGSGVSTLQPTGITVSPYIPVGTYYIVLIADDDGVVPEVNENNNVTALMLNITSSAQPGLGHDEARLETDVPLSGAPASLVRGLAPGASDAYLHER